MAACDAMDWAPLAVLAGQASHTYRLDGGGRKRGTVAGATVNKDFAAWCAWRWCHMGGGRGILVPAPPLAQGVFPRCRSFARRPQEEQVSPNIIIIIILILCFILKNYLSVTMLVIVGLRIMFIGFFWKFIGKNSQTVHKMI